MRSTKFSLRLKSLIVWLCDSLAQAGLNETSFGLLFVFFGWEFYCEDFLFLVVSSRFFCFIFFVVSFIEKCGCTWVAYGCEVYYPLGRCHWIIKIPARLYLYWSFAVMSDLRFLFITHVIARKMRLTKSDGFANIKFTLFLPNLRFSVRLFYSFHVR